MHFQQFEDIKFLFFALQGIMPPYLPNILAECPKLGGIVSILRENPESRLDFSGDTASIPILKISPHKPTSREIYFC